MSTSPQTFVFADLAGYSALTDAHGDDAAADAAGSFCEAVRALLDEHEAHEVKAIGDEVMLRVPEPAAAVRLAARIAAELGGRHGSLAVHVGMHTGPAVERGGDWFGATVNVAARVAKAADAGEVLMTAATREAAGAELRGRDVRARGPCTFKNVAAPVELFALLLRDPDAMTRLATDPVCRMAVDPAHAPERLDWGGTGYRFCSARCREAFEARPDRYAGDRAPG